jgi:MFS family permease
MNPFKRSRPRITSKATSKLEFLNFIFDAEKRNGLTWACTLTGGMFIAGYYFSLGAGFTPTINLGQASLLVFLSFFIGTVLVFASCVSIFAPTFAYRLLEVNIDNFPQDQKFSARRALIIRSFAAQCFLISTFFGATTYAYDDPKNNCLGLFAAIVISLISVGILASYTKLTKYDLKEPHQKYWGSILLIMLFSFSALLNLFMLLPDKSKINTWEVLTGWLFVALFSAILSVFEKKQKLLAVSITLLAFFWVLNFLGMGSIMFKVTAYAIGIAENRPVTLVFPHTSCTEIRRVLHPTTQMTCDGEQAGVLHEVNLLNSLGERWVIREPNSLSNIIFNGNNVVIKKDLTAPSKK